MTRAILQQTCWRARARALTPRRRWVRSLALVPVTALAAASIIGPSEAEPGGLAGAWTGGGWVSFSTGGKEKARCRARYRRYAKDTYKLRAICATTSGKASQTATVYKVTATRYRGSFYNTEYNVRGTIRVVLHGRSQSVRLAGDGASASLRLSRR